MMFPMTKVAPPELLSWINQQLEIHNLTGAEASRRAGLNVGAISEIMNGRTPGLEVCKALARQFGVSPEYVLQLAGHLPKPRQPDPELVRMANEIQVIWREVKQRDPEAARQLINIAIVQAEAFLALVKRKGEEEE